MTSTLTADELTKRNAKVALAAIGLAIKSATDAYVIEYLKNAEAELIDVIDLL